MAVPVRRALIIGGGIGGLTTAAALVRSGVEVAVYEQAEELREVGAGLTLWANAVKALRRLGLADAVVAAGSKIERGEVRTARGRTLSRSEPGELERLYGEPTVAIHRADLHEILLSALTPGTVRLGERCEGFEQDAEGVTARFASGREDRAELVVGADGLRSVVRARLFPEAEPRYAGYTTWRGVVATRDEAALGLTSESWGRGSRFGILRIDAARVYWYASVNAPAGTRQSPAERKGFLRQRFAGWHHPVGHLIDSTPAEDILHNDIYDLKPLGSWTSGRVTLLGDAAHPTTPNLGQGACMAIESGVVLARALTREPTLDDALRRYESERRARTAWVTEQSRRIGVVGQLEHPLACAVRDLLFRLAPERLVRRTIEKAAGYEI